MKRTYLIDSENINDVWVEILDALEIGDCIMVFSQIKAHTWDTTELFA